MSFLSPQVSLVQMECIAQYGSDSEVDEVGKEVGTLDAKRKAKLDSQERRAQEWAQMRENTCPVFDRWDDDRTSILLMRRRRSTIKWLIFLFHFSSCLFIPTSSLPRRKPKGL